MQKGEAMTSDDSINLSTQELEERFDLLATNAQEYAVFLIEPAGNLICWNPGAERLFGYRSDEIIGKHFSRLFSPEDCGAGNPNMNSRRPSKRGVRTASAGRCGRTAAVSGVSPS